MSTTTISAAAAGAREASRHGDGQFGVQARGESGDVALLERPVTVLDGDGNPVALTPGVLDERAEYAYLNGQCLALAVATARRTGSGLVVRWDYDDEDEWVAHVWAADDPAAVLGDEHGAIRDVMGLDTVRAYEQRYDFDYEGEYEAICAADVEAALPKLEAGLSPQDYDTAGTFVDAVMARGQNQED